MVGVWAGRWTGEVFERRLTPDHREILEWVGSCRDRWRSLMRPARRGSGWRGSLAGGRDRCVVAAPSKLQRPSGDRVKTDTRDARHLARLLHLGEIMAVTVPRWSRRPPGTWCGLARTAAGT